MSSFAFQCRHYFKSNLQNRRMAMTATPLQQIEQITFLIDDVNSESKQYYSYFSDKLTKKGVSWRDALEHAMEKLSWENINKNDSISSPLKMNVIGLSQLNKDEVIASDIVIMIGNLEINEDLVSEKRVFLTFDCTNKFQGLQKIGHFKPSAADDNVLSKLSAKVDKLLKNERYRDSVVYSTVKEIWERKSIDDLLFAVMILIDKYSSTKIMSVQSVTSTESTSIDQLKSMCNNCAKEMIDCFSDPVCRKALACLNACKGNDQVCSYRCITSYESPEFQRFAFCILQKHNCMGNTATAPIYPDPSPLQFYRGLPLTHETAEEIFIGHLKPQSGDHRPLIHDNSSDSDLYRDWSWKVVAGKNAAYDFFNCQHQIFYRQKSYFWYDPVFKVETLDGQEVWRRRHYRVKRGKVPGTFYFSVLDNGVKSEEFWRIVEAADDLSWAVFYYSGAAAAAGTSYSGCIVGTKDGEWPETSMNESGTVYRKLSAAMIAAGNTKMWELYEVENDCCDLSSERNRAGQPPLGYKNT